MAGVKPQDLAREYFEAKMAQRLDRREFIRLSSGVVITTAAWGGIGSILAACAGAPASTVAPASQATAVPATAGPATPAATQNIRGATVDYIGLDGEDGLKETAAWRTANGVELKSTYLGGDDLFAKIKAGEVFDVSISYNANCQRFAGAGILQPLDTARLANWPDMFPNLRKGDFTIFNGQTYMAPIAWGDGPFIYNPGKIPSPPKSVRDLLDPAWKGRLTGFDNPVSYIHTLAVAKGYPSPKLTREQLDEVLSDVATLVGYHVAFVKGYQDATDILVRGEADLAFSGWEAMLTWADEKGTELAFDFFVESHGGGWSDGLSLPRNSADIDAAYAYIDAMISPEINAVIATNLQSGTVNAKAVAMLDKASLAAAYDYTLVADEVNPIKFEVWNPPDEPEAGFTSKKDWEDAWQRIRAGA